eukprot:206478-Rhodomonas_salina.1
MRSAIVYYHDGQECDFFLLCDIKDTRAGPGSVCDATVMPRSPRFRSLRVRLRLAAVPESLDRVLTGTRTVVTAT